MCRPGWPGARRQRSVSLEKALDRGSAPHLSLCIPLRGLTLCAIGAVAGCGEGTGESGREREPQANAEAHTVETVETPVFHSGRSSDPRVRDIGRLNGAMFVEPDRYVFVDGFSRQLVFVGTASGNVLAVGGEGDGPGEYASPQLLSRTDGGGVAVWDRPKLRLTLVHPDGTVDQTASYVSMSLSPFPISDNLSVVARFADGTVAFREPQRVPHDGNREAVGRYRDTLQYLIQPSGQSPAPFARLLDEERFRSRRGTGQSEDRVIFGHLSLWTQVGQHLALSQTDLGVVQVFDRSGALVGTVSLPRGSTPPTDRIAAERDRRRTLKAASARMFAELSGQPVSETELDEWAASLPVNRVAPSIDRMIGDLVGRLWLRMFRTDAQREEWQVWNIAGAVPSLEFILALPMGEELLDAAGDRVLVRQKDALDVSYVVVREIEGL